MPFRLMAAPFALWMVSLWMVCAAAFGGEWLTDIHALAHNPRAYYAKTITVEAMQCIEAAQGFQCIKDAGNRVVQVDAPFIGSSTSQDVTERLEARCRSAADQTHRE